jgi:LDH2 family malate/lactate/ureidoglycolate dehydrogenase
MSAVVTARYDINEVKSLMQRALLGLGFPQSDTEVTADTLLYAELRGNNQG